MLAERGTIFWEIGADAGAHTRLAIQRSAEYRAAKIVQHLRAAPPAVIQASPPEEAVELLAVEFLVTAHPL